MCGVWVHSKTEKMRYTKETKEKAFSYFCKGLKSAEIGKLMDLNFRTVQEFSRTGDWKARRADLRVKNERQIIKRHQREQRRKTGK